MLFVYWYFLFVLCYCEICFVLALSSVLGKDPVHRFANLVDRCVLLSSYEDLDWFPCEVKRILMLKDER